MSHEITDTDGMMLAKVGAWHGLGTVVEEAQRPHEALQVAGLDWRAEEADLVATPLRGPIKVPAHKAIIRSDTDHVLGVVSKAYEPFQNEELADLVLALDARKGGPVLVESAGSMKGGRTVFFLAQLGSWGVGIGDADTTKSYALFTMAHDGSRALKILPTDIRVVCANTEAWARDVASRERVGYSIRHTLNMRDRVQEVSEALQGYRRDLGNRQAQAQALADRAWSVDERRAFFLEIYEDTFGEVPTAAEAKVGDTKERRKAERKRGRAKRVLASWELATNADSNTVAGIQGTAWAGLNVVTDWIDHHKTVRTKGAESAMESRAHNALFGPNSAIKLAARKLALATL